MTHRPFIIFETLPIDYQNPIEARTRDFNKALYSMSGGDGLMEGDIESLCKFYDVPHPYE